MIDQFRSVGHDLCSMGLGMGCFGGVGILIARLFKKHVPYTLWGWTVSLLLMGLFHVPSHFMAFFMSSAMGIGGYFDVSRYERKWTRKAWTSVWCGLLIGVIPVYMSIQDARQITLDPNNLSDRKQSEITTIARAPLQVEIVTDNQSKGRSWHFLNKIGETSVAEDEYFIDSSGHLYRGDDLGRLIARWGNVKPTANLLR